MSDGKVGASVVVLAELELLAVSDEFELEIGRMALLVKVAVRLLAFSGVVVVVVEERVDDKVESEVRSDVVESDVVEDVVEVELESLVCLDV